MNEITHEQARSLMQSEADGLLDQSGLARQEWANLQAHVENCAECRAQQRRLRALQRELHGALRSGLDAYQPPPVSIQPLIDARAARERGKRRLLLAAIITPLVLLVGLLGWWFRVDQLLIALLDPWGTAAKEFYASFDGKIVYESRISNGMDLYMLQGGASPVQLTDDPAEDSDPVWSPDGQWIAFLSDRAADPLNVRAIEPRDQLFAANMLFPTPTAQTGAAPSKGKREVFVLAPGAGGPPVQLSQSPDLAWLAPLSWAGDGKSLALVGKLLPAAIDNQNSYAADTWVYTLALDGSGATRLAGTRGATQARYAPNGRWLGFQRAILSQRQFVFIEPAAQDGAKMSLLEPADELGSIYLPGDVFAWSPGGSDMAYLVEGPYTINASGLQPSNRAVSQLRRLVGFPGGMPVTMQVEPMMELPLVDGLRDVAWSPDGTSMVVLQGTDQDPCWSVLVGRVPQMEGSEMQIIPVDGLCAEGHLTTRPWTPDGRWLVFAGRWHGENAAIYALDVQQVIEHPNYAPLVARLTEPNLADRKPQVQPTFPDLGLQPQAAQTEPRHALSAEALAQATGWLALTSTGVNGQGLMELLVTSPAQPPLLVGSAESVFYNITQPAWQPGVGLDEANLVWVTHPSPTQAGSSVHLYMNQVQGTAEGRLQLAQPTPIDLTPAGAQLIQSPAWSADGQKVAAIEQVTYNPGRINATNSTQLAIYDASGYSEDTGYVRVGGGIEFIGPLAWAPTPAQVGSQRIAALVSGQPFNRTVSSSMALAVIDLDGAGPNQALIVYQPVDGLSPEQVTGLVWIPAEAAGDGVERVAVLGMVEEAGMVTPRVVVLRADAADGGQASFNAWFAEYALAPNQRPAIDGPLLDQFARGDRLRWRPGTGQPMTGHLTLVVNENTRARVVAYPLDGGAAATLLDWPEPVHEHAWSPDGRWLALAGESGVWLVDMPDPQALPYRLASVGGWDLAWK